jgi:proteic killer suppression protein
VKLAGFRSKALRRLFLEDDGRGVPADAALKLRMILTFLQDIGDIEELRKFPLWKAHRLTGDRKDYWSLTVTRNWRLTFRTNGQEITEIDFEDYH